MRVIFGVFVLLLSSWATAQECTTRVWASFYDQRTTEEVQTLKTEDFEVKMNGQTLPVANATRDFDNRLLILLETEGAAKNEKLSDLVQTVTLQARQAPEGKPVAFGVFAEKALFTKGFSADPDKRTAAVNEVIEEAGPLGKRVALWDALHQALAVFGAHQPGDTILLIGDPYDDASRHSAEDVEKEFVTHGTRLFMMRRLHGSRVDRDFLWKSHELEKTVLARIIQETGGLLSEYMASLIRFSWAGYLLEINVPPGMKKAQKWKLRFRGPAADVHKKTNFYYPALLPACQTASTAAR
jgi:hypothetical protein